MIASYETGAKLAKKCPFCGSKAIKTLSKAFVEETVTELVYIKCDDCGAKVEAFTDGCNFNEGYRQALKTWNRRSA